jgi:crotonobetainyl-CoA:carnitine CoA-transferase CaiB-like acyl-CoA transferase
MKSIRVIDLTQHLSGPYCTWTLATVGADIIKVEALGKGDGSRETPPFLNERSIYFDSLNRGKRSVAIDLKSEQGRAILHDLLRTADVMVENFRPGVRDRLGCSDKELADINPRLILCSISGFGQAGELAKHPAYDIVAQAMSGMMSINGARGAEGVRVGFSIGDIAAGLFAAIGILGRLYERDVQGAHRAVPLDISMVGCQVALLENAYARYLNAGQVPEPLGSRHPSMAPFETFSAADGALVIALGTNADWPRFCAAIGALEIEHDPRFHDTTARLAHRDELEETINKKLATQGVEHWLTALRNVNIACAPVWTVPEFASSDYAKEFDTFTPVVGDPSARYIRHPLTTAEPTPAAPRLGQHTREVLLELGYSNSLIEELERGKYIEMQEPEIRLGSGAAVARDTKRIQE